MQIFWAMTGLLATGAAILSLWWGWRRSGSAPGPRWIALALGIAGAWSWIRGFGAEIGVPLLFETWALLGFAFILTRIEWRTDSPRAPRAERGAPRVRRRYGRGLLQGLIAGPLAFAAAIGIAALIATRAPLDEQTRLVGAGLMVPSLWAGFVGWTVAAERLRTPFASMTLFAALGFGCAFGLAR